MRIRFWWPLNCFLEHASFLIRTRVTQFVSPKLHPFLEWWTYRDQLSTGRPFQTNAQLATIITDTSHVSTGRPNFLPLWPATCRDTRVSSRLTHPPPSCHAMQHPWRRGWTSCPSVDWFLHVHFSIVRLQGTPADLLIAPNWPNQSWFPFLPQLLCNQPFLCLPVPDLLIQILRTRMSRTWQRRVRALKWYIERTEHIRMFALFCMAPLHSGLKRNAVMLDQFADPASCCSGGVCLGP